MKTNTNLVSTLQHNFLRNSHNCMGKHSSPTAEIGTRNRKNPRVPTKRKILNLRKTPNFSKLWALKRTVRIAPELVIQSVTILLTHALSGISTLPPYQVKKNLKMPTRMWRYASFVILQFWHGALWTTVDVMAYVSIAWTSPFLGTIFAQQMIAKSQFSNLSRGKTTKRLSPRKSSRCWGLLHSNREEMFPSRFLLQSTISTMMTSVTYRQLQTSMQMFLRVCQSRVQQRHLLQVELLGESLGADQESNPDIWDHQDQ